MQIYFIPTCSSLLDIPTIQPEPYCIFTHKQTQGRGSHNRKWVQSHSIPNHTVAQSPDSILARLVDFETEFSQLWQDIYPCVFVIPTDVLPTAVMASYGLMPWIMQGVLHACQKVCDQNIWSIKLPNDIIHTETQSKVAGVLVEQQKNYYHIGIGCNGNTAPILDRPTTCLAQYSVESTMPMAWFTHMQQWLLQYAK
jgi:biotin-(acetyl-CoA carboxylase) ligase